MARLNNPMEILKLLDKSNCGECNEATCLAFAARVFKGQKTLNECPHVAQDILMQFGGEPKDLKPAEEDQEEILRRLKGRLNAIDLVSTGKRLGAAFKDDKLTLKICGKDLSVDSMGNFYSEIHTHSWLTLPVLNYILEGAGVQPSGKWVSFRELKGGKEWGRFFEHRCEKPMKRVADTYPDFFADMLHIFAGKQVEREFDSDISLVLYPLPKVPILICYWKPEDDLESDFHLFFDSTAENNLSIDSIYLLLTGLSIMFEKIARRHN
jgi:hypothetical protein